MTCMCPKETPRETLTRLLKGTCTMLIAMEFVTTKLVNNLHKVCPEKVQPLLIKQEWFTWHRCNLAAKDSGLECACVNNGDFIVLASGGGRCHRVSMCTVWLLHSKWLSKYNNECALNFALSLNILLWKQFRWFRRPQLWATGDWQLHHHNVSVHASYPMQSFQIT